METITLIQPNSTHKFIVLPEESDMRLDLYLKKQFPSYSRSFLKTLILKNLIFIENKKVIKPRTELKEGNQISVTFPEINTERTLKDIPEDLDVPVLNTDKHFLIINKPAGLVVHPPKIDCDYATLVDWLVNRFCELSFEHTDRPGIVHRLDRDSSGIMIVARNGCAQAKLSDLFKNREIEKTYLAIVHGHPEKEGVIDFDIKRHPVNRNTVTCVRDSILKERRGKVRHAKTNFKVLEYFEDYSLVEVKPVTGRTHQIRVHFSTIGHPLAGDTVYGKSSKKIKRHALHAYKLAFEFNGKQHNFCCEPPKDFNLFLKKISNN